MENYFDEVLRAMEKDVPVQNCQKRFRNEEPRLFSEASEEQIRKAIGFPFANGIRSDCTDIPHPEPVGLYDGLIEETNIIDDTPDESSSTPAVFLLKHQRRRGPRHGRGGRTRGPSNAVRRRNMSSEVMKVFIRAVIDACGGTPHAFTSSMKSALSRMIPGYELSTHKNQLLIAMSTSIGSGNISSMYEVLPAPYFTICIKLPYSQTGTTGLFAMNRHAVCCWLEESGRPLCTCMGSTSFRIGIENCLNAGTLTAHDGTCSLCEHVKGINGVINRTSIFLGLSFTISAKLIVELYARSFRLPLATYIYIRPRRIPAHKNTVLVISSIAPGTIRTIQLVPVRRVMKGSGGFVCAFCNTVLLLAALFNITQFERNVNHETGRNVRISFGQVLRKAASAVKTFYTYFDNTSSEHSAISFASKWAIEQKGQLKTLMTNEFEEYASRIKENAFQEACYTGSTFQITLS